MNRWSWSALAGGLLLSGCASTEPAVVTMYGGDPSSPAAVSPPFEPPPELLAGERAAENEQAEPAQKHPHSHDAGRGVDTGTAPAEAAPVHGRSTHLGVTSPAGGERAKCGPLLARREVGG